MQADGCAEQTGGFFRLRCWLLREQSVYRILLPRKPVQILLIAQGFFRRDEGLGTACHFAAGGRNSPVQELPCVSKYSSVLRIAKSHGDGDANREIAIFADGREGLRVRILYAVGRSLQTTLALDDGTASGGK